MAATDGSSSTDIWAVGSANSIIHWDGLAWQKFPRVVNQDLFDVTVISPSDAWAVGNHATILDWDGVSWAPFANPGVPAKHSFNTVTAPGPSDVWVAGNGIILKWNGLAWSAPDIQPLNAVYRGSVTDPSGQMWLVGGGAIVKRE